MARLTIVTSMKNEAPFLLEWIAHYRVLGFTDILIATNDCTDGTVEMIARLEELGLARLHRTRIRAGGIHRSAIRQLSRFEEVKTADWIFVCDADEFLNIHYGDGGVEELIEATGGPDVISVTWRIFGPNGQGSFADRRMTEQFTRAEAPRNRGRSRQAEKFVKSLFRGTLDVRRMGLHYPLLPNAAREGATWVAGDGKDYRVNSRGLGRATGWQGAQVNHYALRSLDSYLVKRDRGRANHMGETVGLSYWRRFDKNHVEDTSIARYATRSDAMLAELKADPRLGELHEAAVAWHRAKAAEMRGREELAEMIAEMEATLAPDPVTAAAPAPDPAPASDGAKA
ncbi:MAG: glycosyltransferase family 2 protein [Pseudomonadota bacterium]